MQKCIYTHHAYDIIHALITFGATCAFTTRLSRLTLARLYVYRITPLTLYILFIDRSERGKSCKAENFHPHFHLLYLANFSIYRFSFSLSRTHSRAFYYLFWLRENLLHHFILAQIFGPTLELCVCVCEASMKLTFWGLRASSRNFFTMLCLECTWNAHTAEKPRENVPLLKTTQFGGKNFPLCLWRKKVFCFDCSACAEEPTIFPRTYECVDVVSGGNNEAFDDATTG